MNSVWKTSILFGAFAVVSLGQVPGLSKRLLQEPLPDLMDSKWSLYTLSLAPGASVPPHSHVGMLVAYVLDGDIENQLDPDPPQVYHPGDFFREQARQIHRMFRNLNQSEPARLLIFQNTSKLPSTIQPLIQEPAAEKKDQELSVNTMTLGPGATTSDTGQRSGSGFFYILKGEVENRIDPGQSNVYHAGEAFYAAPMQAHRLWNRATTEPVELLLFQIASTGRP